MFTCIYREEETDFNQSATNQHSSYLSSSEARRRSLVSCCLCSTRSNADLSLTGPPFSSSSTSPAGPLAPALHYPGSYGLSNDASNGAPRAKRVRKKRQLSPSELNPDDLDDDGELITTERQSKRVVPSVLAPQSPTSTPEDREYFERVQINEHRSQISEQVSRPFRPPQLIWSLYRKTLYAALDFFQDSVKTEGASVSISQQGIARAVMLEGELPKGSLTRTHFSGWSNTPGTVAATM